jgi:hypothetical protein
MAYLGGAHLGRADLTGADLKGAKATVLTVWPEAFDAISNGVTFGE